MRPFFLLAASAAVLLGVVACSGRAVGTREPEDTPAPPSAQPLECVARDATWCRDLPATTVDEPTRDGAIAWAQITIAGTTPDRTGGTPKIAIYPDGTLRRTPVQRNLVFTFTPPQGLLVAKIDSVAVGQISTDVAQVNADDLRGYFGPHEAVTADSGGPYDVFDLKRGMACGHVPGDNRSSCMPPALAKLRAHLAALAGAADNKWREAQAGTVSIGASDMTIAGDWPFSDDRAKEGGGTFSGAEWSLLGGSGVYRLESGDFVQVNFAIDDEKGAKLVYITRMSAVTLGDDLASVRTELIANEGRYELSRGSWLGVELGADRFPAFKNREVAILPASGATPSRLRYLYAIEHLDLQGDGALALP